MMLNVDDGKCLPIYDEASCAIEGLLMSDDLDLNIAIIIIIAKQN